MRPYVVRDGDHLARLAYTMGFDAQTIWKDPKNADLKEQRGNPNILCAGDVLYVPESARNWLSVNVGAVNTFVANPPLVPFSATFSRGGKPLAGVDCIVHGMPPPNTFTTDGSGKLQLSLPVTVQVVTVEFPTVPLVRRLHVGSLDPVSEPSGIIQRLRSLGHVSARTTPSDPASVARALAAFQTSKGLSPTGTLDDDTQKALQAAHGC